MRSRAERGALRRQLALQPVPFLVGETAGMPSARNINCQPCSPKAFSDSIAVETGLPITVEIGSATMNVLTIRARVAAGNQYVRYRIMPGKKPASATPSRKRNT
jgi:hypothetical protein